MPRSPSAGSRPRDASDEELFRRYATGDVDARQRLAERYMVLACRLAGRYRNSSESREDLEQVACVGLLKAIDRFESGRGPFVGFLVPYVRGELKRHFRDEGWDLQVPRSVQEHYLLVTDADEKLATVLGRSPTPRDLARHTKLTLEQVVEALDASTAYSLQTLEAPTSLGDGSGLSIGESLGADDPGYSAFELSTVVSPALKSLPRRDREVLLLRVVHGMKQREIGDALGISQMHVSRLLRRSLRALGEAVARDGGLPPQATATAGELAATRV